MNIRELREIAEKARSMPLEAWDEFRGEVTPETVLALLDVAEAAQGVIAGLEDDVDDANGEALLVRLASALAGLEER